MNKTIKKIKAVSPIVATIILIIITIIAGIVIYFYVSGYLAGGATNVSLKITGGAVAPGAGKKIFVTVTIKNDGTVPVQLNNLAVVNPAVGISSPGDGSYATLAGLGTLDSTNKIFSFAFGDGNILAAGQSVTVQFRYTTNVPVAGANLIIRIDGINTVTGQTVGFLVNFAITPA
jgi:flagellin-like protein